MRHLSKSGPTGSNTLARSKGHIMRESQCLAHDGFFIPRVLTREAVHHHISGRRHGLVRWYCQFLLMVVRLLTSLCIDKMETSVTVRIALDPSLKMLVK